MKLWLATLQNQLKTNRVIWFISKYALPPEYGVQARLFHLATSLKKNSREAIVITSSTNHLANLPIQSKRISLKHYNGVQTIFLKGLRFKGAISSYRVISWFYFEFILLWFILFGYRHIVAPPRIVYVSSLSLLSILNGYIAKKKFKAKLIFEVRDIWPLSAILVAGYSKYHPFILFLRLVEKFGYLNSDIVVSPLSNLKQHIEVVTGKSTLRFRCIPQGFTTDFSKEKEKLSKEFINKYIPKEKFIFGYIGNIVSAYDLDTLLLCARIMNIKSPEVSFVILGDGEYKETLIEKSRDIPNVIFAPRIPKSQVQDFLDHCHVATNFLRPEPLFKYGVSPQKLVDYMLAAKPILMSYTGYKSIVEEIGNGLVIEAGNIDKLVDAMIALSKTPRVELEEIGLKGKKFLISNLSWDSIVSQNIDLFE